MNIKHKLFLLFIILLAAFLRLYKLTDVPPGVNRDEASIGYTAYSLLATGKDEYGKSFPLSFESFGDWKLPLYIYITVPFVKIFGLNELAVRLPSALAGIFTVLLTYFLVTELFNKSRFTTLYSLLSTLLLAISPWHLHLSRVESESNIAVFLIVAGVLLFLKGINGKRPLLLALSLPLFALTYYTYHGNHVFTTLLLIGLCVLYHKKIPRTPAVMASTIISIVLIAFILSQTFLSADKTKLSGISIFGDPFVIHEKIELPRNIHPSPNGIIARLTHNRLTFAAETIAQNYIKAFSPEFLFLKGGTNRAHNIQNFGNLYLLEAPFFYLGIFLLIFLIVDNSKLLTLNSKLLLWWLLISPVAASITKDAPHTNRMFAIFPLPPILVALALVWLWTNLPKQKLFRNTIVVVLVFAFLSNIAIYMDRYFIHFPATEWTNWGTGYKKLAKTLSQEENKSKRVIVTNPEYSPYIFLLFYSGFDPATYQNTVTRYPPTNDAFVHVKAFDRFEFRDIDWKAETQIPNRILVDLKQWKIVDTGNR